MVAAGNSKFEAPNTKEIRKPKDQKSKQMPIPGCASHLTLFGISDFGSLVLLWYLVLGIWDFVWKQRTAQTTVPTTLRDDSKIASATSW
jgi:hypothetical protein